MIGLREPTLLREAIPLTHPSQGSRRLDLREVRECGAPAVFFDYGEALLYLDGQLFSLRDVREKPGRAMLLPPPLPAQVLEIGVGLEYGWRHVSGCRCHLCRNGEQEQAA